MKNSAEWAKFIANCRALNNEQELQQFLDLLLTPAERENIAARYMILFELLHTHKTHREIAADLEVSIFNVTRGANQLKLSTAEVTGLIQPVTSKC